MKTRYSAVLAVCVFAAAESVLSAGAPAGQSQFPMIMELVPPVAQSNDIGSIRLDHGIFARADANLANVRLFDGNGVETPFTIRRNRELRPVAEETAFPAGQLSIKTLPDNKVEIMCARDPAGPVPSAIAFESQLRDFEKRITVWGSPDGAHWALLAENDTVFDYSRFLNVRKDRVGIARADDASFYRIEVSNVIEEKESPFVQIMRRNGSDAAVLESQVSSFRREPFRIDRILFVERKESTRETTADGVTVTTPDWSTAQDASNQTTIIEFRTDRQPVTAVRLQTGERNFSRVATVDGNRDSTNQVGWERVGADRISLIRAGQTGMEHMTIPLSRECRFPRYRVTVQNQDNPPIAFSGVAVVEVPYELLFFPKPGSCYRLLFGGTGISAPRYDIDTVLGALPPGRSAQWSLEPETANPAYRGPARVTATWSGRNLLTAAVIAMAAVLILLIAIMIRKVENGPHVM